MPTDTARDVEVLIIGSGFSGLALAVYLRNAGIDDFVILEKAAGLGGTWRENTYPGAECDVASVLYSYSFEHNARWRYKWAEQAQILEYLQQVAAKYDLPAHLRLNREVVSATWDEAARQWLVDCADGSQWRCRFLVSAVGQLHRPATPDLPGREKFSGPAFHTARWRHDVNLAGKQVAVIGNAASALQVIPQIAARAARVTVYQRSANWVLPKLDRPYRPWEQWLSDRIPGVAKLYRLRLWLVGELMLYAIIRGNRLVRGLAEGMSRRYLARVVADPALRAKLTPDYPMGAKRILFSDNYYDALVRPNVELVTTPIAAIDAAGLATADGTHRPADVLVFATGFQTNPFLAPMTVSGVGGRSLADHWKDGAHAYLGMVTAGFPNLFMMYGPNTNLGHNSIIVMSEAQARYIVACVRGAGEAGVVAVRAAAEQRFNDEMQRRLAHTAWRSVSASWYMDRGRITNNWPGSTFEYLRRCARVHWSDFEPRSASR